MPFSEKKLSAGKAGIIQSLSTDQSNGAPETQEFIKNEYA